MPSYEYNCTDCQNPFVIERSIKDESTPACSHCGSESVRRIFSVFIQSGKSSRPKSSASAKTNACAPAPSSHSGGCCGGMC